MKTPLILYEKDSRDVCMFSSAAALERYVEPIDVENGEYQAYDADGKVLDLTLRKSVHKESFFCFTVVDCEFGNVSLIEDKNVYDRDTLRNILAQYSKAMGIVFEINPSLEELIDVLIKDVGYTK
ncbi:MAG: hypothetical protein IPI58_08770 [Alphaproteobacteria bacterium]|nr:MAG: hypothetical protein IPI58_08770 [Alphaproteobacteria bacterium]